MPLPRFEVHHDRTKAALQESVAVYRQQLLVAFAEVEDNLVALRTLDGQAQSTRDSLTSAARAARIADVRYNAGATSYLDVIEAQRTLLTVQRLDTQIRGAHELDCRADSPLGGGWDAPVAMS
ncbi:MAG: TolC family protein, partial [Burkholderiales bacterium]